MVVLYFQFQYFQRYFRYCNFEKILQKIRLLFRESFFYKKENLLRLIQIPKPYPIIQIYAALSHLIESNNEFINDRYGRNGTLVNIGDYYLFQPIELNDPHIPIFERSVPIDYKHESIKIIHDKPIELPKEAIDVKHTEKVKKYRLTTFLPLASMPRLCLCLK